MIKKRNRVWDKSHTLPRRSLEEGGQTLEPSLGVAAVTQMLDGGDRRGNGNRSDGGDTDGDEQAQYTRRGRIANQLAHAVDDLVDVLAALGASGMSDIVLDSVNEIALGEDGLQIKETIRSGRGHNVRSLHFGRITIEVI